MPDPALTHARPPRTHRASRPRAAGACAGLVALGLLAAGCGERRAHFTPDEVRAAFGEAGIHLEEPGDGSSDGTLPADGSVSPVRPWEAMLGGIREALGLPAAAALPPITVLRDVGPASLRGDGLRGYGARGDGTIVFVYARDHEAAVGAAEYKDEAAADRILGRRIVSVDRRGNVVVLHRYLSTRSRSYDWTSTDVNRLNTQAERRVAAALDRLG
jgi:hypothetical protein